MAHFPRQLNIAPVTTRVPGLAGLDLLRSETSGDPRIRIAVLDGPVDVSHPCFSGANLTSLTTLAPGGAKDGPASQHGTHVASIIFGRAGSAVSGIAPGCSGIIIPVFSDGPGGELITVLSARSGPSHSPGS